MKTLKDFWNYRVLGKTPPALRGRVDTHNVAAPPPVAVKARELAAARERAKAGKRSGMIVYRAVAETWEEFKDAQVKEGPPLDDEAQST